MAIIGSASIQIRADDKYFEPDVQRAVRRIKNVAIQLKADVDLTKASKKIRDLRYRITSKDAVLKVDANVAKAEAKLAKLLAKFIDKNMEFTATANTQGANTKLTELRDRFKNNRVSFTANADTAAARAALNAAARNRTSTIKARIDPVTMGALQGLFNTLTGTLPYEKIKASIAGVAANFEGLATKGTAVVSILGAISAAVLTTGANLLSIGGDITEVIGIAGVFPAALFGVVTAVKATTMAWKGFGDAMKEAKTPAQLKAQQAALAKLPPEAQKAVKALREIRGEIQKPVQKAYWEAMGTSLQDLISKKFPELKAGMIEVGGAMGRYTSKLFDAIGNTGDFNDVFINVRDSIDNLAKGMEPAIDALTRWIGIGSSYLPRFGDWVSNLATKFAAWTKEADETGKMNIWIETGIRRIQELGSIVKSTAGFFGGLADAARISGAPGLTEMAAGMREVRDIVNGEPFQSRLVMVLEGARAGTEALGAGFKKLTGLIGDSAGSIGIFLGQAGGIGGQVLDSVRALFDGTGLGNGLTKAVGGLSKALDTLKPGFSDLGGVIGSLGEIAAAVLEHMAPSLNQLFDSLDKIVNAVKEGIIKAMPVFNDFIQNIMAAAQGPVVAFATAIGNMLTGFSELPGTIQTVMMSIGLFLLLKNRFLGFFSGLGKSLNDEKTSMGRAFGQIQEGARITGAGVADSFSTLGAAMKNALVTSAEAGAKAFSPIIGRAEDAADRSKSFFAAMREGMRIGPELDTVRAGFQNLQTSVSQTARGMGDTLKGVGQDIVRSVIPEGLRDAASRVHNDLAPARQAFANLVPAAGAAGRQAGAALGSGIRSASAGFMEAMGGGWGLALSGATIALGLFASAQAETEGKISSLSGALDEQSAAFNESARKMFAAEVLDQNANWWDDLARSGRRNMEELVRDTGMNMNKVMDTLTDPKGRDGFVDNWKKIRDAAGDGKNLTDELAASVGMTKDQLKGLSQTDLDNLTRQFEKSARLAKEAEDRTLALAKATGKNNVESAALANNFDTLASATSTVDDKFRAFKQNLDITTGGFQNIKNGSRDFAESMFKMEDSVVGVGKQYDGLIEGTKKLSKGFRDTLFAADGTFSTTSRGAIEFSKSMDQARDSVLKAGITEFQALRNAGVELPEAQAKALAKMEPMLDSMRTGLSNLGFDSAQVNQIMGQLGLDPDKLRGALMLDTTDAESKMKRLEMMRAAITTGNWQVALAASSDDVKNELLKVAKYKEAYEKGGWKAVVKLIDEAGPGIDEFMLKMADAKNLDDIKKVIDAEIPGATKISEISETVKKYNAIPLTTKRFEAIDGVTPPKEQAVKSLRDFTTTEIPPKALAAVDSTAPAVEAAKGTMGGLPDVFRGLFGVDSTAPGKDSAQGTMNSLQDVMRNLMANDSTSGGKNSAQGNIDGLTGKTVDLKANDNASGTIGEVDRKSIADKSFNIIGVLTNVSSVVRSFLGMAHGGIMKGGVQKFADGGILDSVKKPQIKAYASGGVENHVAQIAKGAWPVRVWAEPETGGEAYIPLGLNKRKRSLEILRQVMAEFGLSHLAKFADGGVMKNMPASPRRSTAFSGFGNSGSIVTGTARSVAAPTFITNVYPSPGLNEEQIGESAMSSLYWKLSTQI